MRAFFTMVLLYSCPAFAELTPHSTNTTKLEQSADKRDKAATPAKRDARNVGTKTGALSADQNGGMDAAKRNAASAAGAEAMAQSAYVDSLYEKGEITRDDWLRLKTMMTGAFIGGVTNGQSKDQAPVNFDPPKNPTSLTVSGTEFGSTEQPESTAPGIVEPTISPARGPTSVTESDPTEVGAGAQILDLKSQGQALMATTLVPDTARVSESQSTKTPDDLKRLQMDETAKKITTEKDSKSTTTASPGINRSADHKEDIDNATYDKAVLLAQKLLQEHKVKMAAKGVTSKVAGSKTEDEHFREAHAKALLSLQGLKKVKRIQDGESAERGPIKFTDEQVLSALATLPSGRTPSSAITTPWERPESVTAFSEEEDALVNWGLAFMALLGLFAGLAVAYALIVRPQRHTVQLMVPGSGEHFTIRPGNKTGEFILDIMDVRGQLVRTAGTLRPDSVARAAVLPPDLAARLGAKGAFDRFEFTREGQFVRTEKEEGYQVFPFVLS